MQELINIGAGVVMLLGALYLSWELAPESRELRRRGTPGIDREGPGYHLAGHLPRLHVLHAGRDGTLYGIEDHYLYTSEDGGKGFVRRGALPKVGGGLWGKIENRLARSKSLRRMRANPGPNTIEVLRSGTILVFWDRIYRSTDAGDSFHPVFDPASLNLQGGPFGYGVGTAVGADDTVYFGEYTTAKRPHPVRIVRGTEDGAHWEVAWRFEAGEIFHVHSVSYDRFRDGFWVCTGDYDSETSLLFTADDFKTLRTVGAGSQDWRILSLIITPDFLYWGSDNDRAEGSDIFRWNIAEQTLAKLQHIGKVSYYATQLANGTMVISTTYEPESAYTKANSPPASSEVWVSHDGEEWRRMLELPYEPMRQSWGRARAQIAFPAGEPLNRLFLMPRYTQGDPFMTAVLEVRGAATPPASQSKRAAA